MTGTATRTGEDTLHRLRVPLGRLVGDGLPLATGDGESSAFEESTQVSGLAPAGSCLLPKGCVRFVAPSAGGWGIVRGALVVPESVMLFVAPQGCGRHGSVASTLNGYRNRVFYLDVSESELVMGTHVDRTEKMVGLILEALPKKPRAFYICATCVDDLLGSDFHGLCERMTKLHGIPFSDCHMDPVTKSSSTPPPLNLQRSIYRFLCMEGRSESEVQADAVNVIGGFVPVDADSELYPLLRSAGVAAIRQLPACSSFDEYLEMRRSAKNVLIKPFGILACRDMRRSLGIPFCMARERVLFDDVAREYDALSEFLGEPLAYQPFREAAEAHLEDARPWLKGLRVAVGSNLSASSFEIALLLARLEAHISFLITDEVTATELPAAEALARLCPDTPVYPSSHPCLSLTGAFPEQADVAIGFDAARMCPGSSVASFDADVQPFGFQVATSLVDAVRHALDCPQSAKELLYSKGLVV